MDTVRFYHTERFIVFILCSLCTSLAYFLFHIGGNEWRQIMNYVTYYDFDNFDDIYEGIPSVRNGAAFSIFDCIVKFYTVKENQVIFWVSGSNHTKREANEIFEKVTKLLSFLFVLPICSRGNIVEVEWYLRTNNMLSKKTMNTIFWIEKNVNRFNKTSNFFEETLDLLNVAIDNLFKSREEDAFVYFFKVIERIAKHYYVVYMQRHHTRAVTSKNKNDLKSMLKNYALNNLYVELTDDILNRKVDVFYKEIKMEFYGSVFNKISLFITKEEVNMSVDTISKLVKLRNKIAHGDTVDEETLTNCLGQCEYLAMQMFSKQFFRRKYEELHITSYRYSKKYDPYK